jgi:hypothetical protein
MRRWVCVAACCLLLAACSIEMPEGSGDPGARGRLEFTVLFDDGEPAPSFGYTFEPSVSNGGGVYVGRLNNVWVGVCVISRVGVAV